MTPQGQMFLQDLGRVGAFAAMDEAMRQEINPSRGNQIVYQNSSQQLEMPENIIREGGRLRPAPGYDWVNPQDPRDFRVRKKVNPEENVLLFTYNYDKDFNRNGGIDFPEEFVGIKNVFKCGETINVRGIFKEIYYGSKAKLEIYSPNGEKIWDKESIIDKDENGKGVQFDGKFQTGIYKSILYVNNKPIKTHEFEIRE